jgi:hypothetical protein
VIALFLAVIALRPFSHTREAQANPGGPGSVVPLGMDGNSVFLLDSSTGDVWMYTSDNRVFFKGKLTELGQPLAQ